MTSRLQYLSFCRLNQGVFAYKNNVIDVGSSTKRIALFSFLSSQSFLTYGTMVWEYEIGRGLDAIEARF